MGFIILPGGVNISSLNWDANLVVPAARTINVDHIAETTGAHGIVINNVLKADHVGEVTGSHGTVFDNALETTTLGDTTKKWIMMYGMSYGGLLTW